MKYFFFLFLSTIQLSFALTIHQKPILFNAERIALTQQYQKEHYAIDSDSIEIQPKIMILHWTETETLDQAFQTFYPPQSNRKDLPDKLNVSAHYLIDRDGTVYQLMPDNWMARHVIGLNHYAIAIENVGGVENKDDLTQQQVIAAAELVRYLKKKYPHIEYVIGHRDYLDFEGSEFWMEKNPFYRDVKVDPGVSFVGEVKKKSGLY